MTPTTREQREAMFRVYTRQNVQGSYLDYRRTVVKAPLMGCLMVHVNNMYIGIEADGYSHT